MTITQLEPPSSSAQVDFETAACECRPFLFQIAVSAARNPTDAEDIVQEALLRGYRGIRSFRGDCPVRVWLARIVVRVAINHHRSLYRRLKRLVFFADIGPGRSERDRATEFDPPDPSQHPRDRERLLDVRKYIGQLPDEFRTPLMMLAVEGLSIPEIAKILEIPQGTVKSRIFYARKRLKDAMNRLSV